MREGPHTTDDIDEFVGGDLFDRYFTGALGPMMEELGIWDRSGPRNQPQQG